MINFSPNNYAISFYGLKANLRTGDVVLRRINQELNVPIKSNTKIGVKIVEHQLDKKYADVVEKLTALEKKYAVKIDKERERRPHIFESFEECVYVLRESAKTSGIANCSERAYIVQSELLKEKEAAHVIKIIAQDRSNPDLKNKFGEHVFTIFGLKKGCDLTKPETWGDNAVVVDWWANMVMSARDAIDSYKRIFNFKPQFQDLKIESKDLISID